MESIPLAKPVFDDEMRDAAVAAFDERYVLGESVARFEEEFARYHGCRFGVAVGSGTAALQLSYLATLYLGDAVLTSPYSFIATANAAIHAGAVPRFCDIDPYSLNVAPSEVVDRLEFLKDVAAVTPVYLFGRPIDLRPIQYLKENNIPIIADACQAHGATVNGSPIGPLADLTCFSFYPSKNLTVCGDGGMVITDNEDAAEKIRKFRDCGRVSKYVHDVIGYTSRLNSVSAAIGLVQLKHLHEWVEARQHHAREYSQLLGGVKQLRLPPVDNGVYQSAWHLYVVRTRSRDKLAAYLRERGVETGVHYPVPIHLQPIYRKLYGYEAGTFKNAEEAALTCLSLPMFPSLTSEDTQRICELITDFYRRPTP